MYPFSTALSNALRRTIVIAVTVLIIALLAGPAARAQAGDETPDPVAIFNEAQDLHEKGDLAGAIKLYEKALAVLPEFPEAEYQRGTAYLALGNAVDAEKSMRRAVELRPDWTLALAGLGSLLVQKDEFAEGERLLQKVIDLEPQNPPALTAMTDLRLKTNAAAGVLQDLLTRITVLTGKANPTPSLWTARAALETALGKTEAARSSLAGALAIDQKNISALYQTAGLALSDGDVKRANEIADRLLSVGGNSDRLKTLKAGILLEEGKADEALKTLATIERPLPAAAELQRRIETARATTPAELEKQLELAPKDPSILGRLCGLYRRDAPARALDYCRRASEAEPNNINHAVGFGAALVQAKQFDAAVNILRKILKIAPDNSTAHANLATALFQLKLYGEAKAEFLWLAAAEPGSPGAYFFLGVVHDQLSEYLDAMANYQQYLRLADPVANKLDIDKVNLRLPALQKLIKGGQGKSKK
jgi:protein O-GlcNAc transferase